MKNKERRAKLDKLEQAEIVPPKESEHLRYI